jgi:hypothetical protein
MCKRAIPASTLDVASKPPTMVKAIVSPSADDTPTITNGFSERRIQASRASTTSASAVRNARALWKMTMASADELGNQWAPHSGQPEHALPDSAWLIRIPDMSNEKTNTVLSADHFNKARALPLGGKP